MSQLANLDWCSFFSLFYNARGLRCTAVRIPDTILFKDGKIYNAWVTAADGSIQRLPFPQTTLQALERRLLAGTQQGQPGASQNDPVVAVSRPGEARPTLLNAANLQLLIRTLRLVEQLQQDQQPLLPQDIEALWPHGLPTVLQAYIPPAGGMRYITTYVNDGITTSCSSFQRSYSVRYTPPLKDLQPLDADEVEQLSEMAAARLQQDVAAAPEPLRSKLAFATTQMVQYIQRAHDLVLAGISCEYIVGPANEICLIAVLRTEWASNSRGNGAAAHSIANLKQPPIDTSADLEQACDDCASASSQSRPGTADAVMMRSSWRAVDVGIERAEAAVADAQHAAAAAAAAAAARVSGTASSRKVVRQESVQPGDTLQGDEAEPWCVEQALPTAEQQLQQQQQPVTRSSLASFPGGSQHSNNLSLTVDDVPSSPTAAAAAAQTSSSSAMRPAPSKRPATPPQHTRATSPKPASPPAAAAAAAAGSWLPVGHATAMGRLRPATAGSGARPGSSSCSPPRSNDYMPSCGASRVQRSSPLFAQQLLREVEVLKDQLILQHSLAYAAAVRCRQLDADRASVKASLEARIRQLEAANAVLTRKLESSRRERGQLEEKHGTLRERCYAAEAEAAQLKQTLSTERETALSSLRDSQQQRQQLQQQALSLEAAAAELQLQLKEEHAVGAALRRQLVEWSSTLGQQRTVLECPEYTEDLGNVMVMVGGLLEGQVNPYGERYTLQMVLAGSVDMLRSVFLHYSQLEASFTAHWPPAMSLAQFMALCKDTETTDTCAGARIRSSDKNRMLPPRELERVFNAYATNHSVAAGSAAAAAAEREKLSLSYEQFLACITHIGQLLRTSANMCLSECVRDYLSKYLCKASRIKPAGLSKSHLLAGLAVTKKTRKKSGMSPTGGLISSTRPSSAASSHQMLSRQGSISITAAAAAAMQRASSPTAASRLARQDSLPYIAEDVSGSPIRSTSNDGATAARGSESPRDRSPGRTASPQRLRRSSSETSSSPRDVSPGPWKPMWNVYSGKPTSGSQMLAAGDSRAAAAAAVAAGGGIPPSRQARQRPLSAGSVGERSGLGPGALGRSLDRPLSALSQSSQQ